MSSDSPSPTRPAPPPPRVFFPPGGKEPSKFNSVALPPSATVSASGTPNVNGITFHLVPPTPKQPSFSDAVQDARGNEHRVSDEELECLETPDHLRATHLSSKSDGKTEENNEGYGRDDAGDDGGVLHEVNGCMKELNEGVSRLEVANEDHHHLTKDESDELVGVAE